VLTIYFLIFIYVFVRCAFNQGIFIKPMCDYKKMQEYAQWLRSPEGRVAFVQKKRLVETLLSDWPRRGHTVLEIGCGSGLFLELLWEAGLDPTGIESSPELLDIVRKHMGSKVDLHLGKFDTLPFDDDEFDYVAVLSALNREKDLEMIFNEAFRVATKGLLISFNNTWSLSGLLKICNRGSEQMKGMEYYTPHKILSTLRKIMGKTNFSMRTTLLGPPSTWRENAPFSFINRPVTMLPFGACAGLRVDIGPLQPEPYYPFPSVRPTLFKLFLFSL
jgi:Methylase involved in ubiquinone/menaquinone biosynthesis